jgi:hypothetical protein
MDNKNDNTVQNRLAYFPISFFAIILGLTGYSLAFQKAEEFFGFSFKISQ